MTLTALIVDDERLARERIRTLLGDDPELTVVGECADGRAAIAALERTQVDVLFLDVQMPELDGFEVLEALDGERLPAVVFVTAHDEHAVRAFEHAAVDYLLKPFDRDRFARALARAKTAAARQESDALRGALDRVLSQLDRGVPERLVVRDGGRVRFVPLAEITWLEAQGNYVRVHAGAEAPLLRRSLSQLEQSLAAAGFLRVHRSRLVNLRRVRELRSTGAGELELVLDDGTKVGASRRHRERLEKALAGES